VAFEDLRTVFSRGIPLGATAALVQNYEVFSGGSLGFFVNHAGSRNMACAISHSATNGRELRLQMVTTLTIQPESAAARIEAWTESNVGCGPSGRDRCGRGGNGVGFGVDDEANFISRR